MRKKRKGFTLVELLVVIAIIALLMGILMPALAKVRAIAFRVVCGSNLSGLGKAMMIYANDYDDELPRAGGVGATWIPSIPWNAANRFQAYNLNADGSGGQITVASSLYLLIKYAEVGPKQFVCKGNAETDELKLPAASPLDLIDLWDFRDTPIKYCSYSYHSSYGPAGEKYALTTAASQPGMAVAADRNPWLDPAADPAIGLKFNVPGPAEQEKAGNSVAHGNEGQNVLFMDSHVAFEKRAFCAILDDNIYTFCAKGGNIQRGTGPADGSAIPMHKEDSLLLNEGEGVPDPGPGPDPDPDPDPDPPPP